MTERDRVFDAFRNCITEPKCKDCPWTECETIDHGTIEIPRDLALAVMRELAAQEPRVMTLEEFNAHWQIPPQERKPIWEEWKIDNGKGKWKLYGRATGGYGDMWRCWTSRPDQATREAIPWEQ